MQSAAFEPRAAISAGRWTLGCSVCVRVCERGTFASVGDTHCVPDHCPLPVGNQAVFGENVVEHVEDCVGCVCDGVGVGVVEMETK